MIPQKEETRNLLSIEGMKSAAYFEPNPQCIYNYHTIIFLYNRLYFRTSMSLPTAVVRRLTTDVHWTEDPKFDFQNRKIFRFVLSLIVNRKWVRCLPSHCWSCFFKHGGRGKWMLINRKKEKYNIKKSIVEKKLNRIYYILHSIYMQAVNNTN